MFRHLITACVLLSTCTLADAATTRHTKHKASVFDAMAAVPAASIAAPVVAPITKATATADPVTVLQQFTVTDLQNALADAQAQNPPDQAAVQCYTALIPLVQQASGIKGILPKSLGIFQALQKARDAKAMLANLQSPNGPMAQLNLACAPLAMDVQNTLVQLGIITGAVAATGGIGLTLPTIVGGFGGLPLLFH
jgi:hypothetical protein